MMDRAYHAAEEEGLPVYKTTLVPGSTLRDRVDKMSRGLRKPVFGVSGRFRHK